MQDDGDGAYYDLKPYRERYWSDPDVHDLMMGEMIVWRGWFHAVETCDPDNENCEDCGYRATAKLMDERRDILRNGARIRAAFTKIGATLLKEVTPP